MHITHTSLSSLSPSQRFSDQQCKIKLRFKAYAKTDKLPCCLCQWVDLLPPFCWWYIPAFCGWISVTALNFFGLRPHFLSPHGSEHTCPLVIENDNFPPLFLLIGSHLLYWYLFLLFFFGPLVFSLLSWSSTVQLKGYHIFTSISIHFVAEEFSGYFIHCLDPLITFSSHLHILSFLSQHEYWWFFSQLSLRSFFLESLLQPESLRLDWLLLAVSHDAPPSTSTMDDEGDPRYRRSPVSKLCCSFGMEPVYSHIAFWAYFRNSYGSDWLKSW